MFRLFKSDRGSDDRNNLDEEKQRMRDAAARNEAAKKKSHSELDKFTDSMAQPCRRVSRDRKLA